MSYVPPHKRPGRQLEGAASGALRVSLRQSKFPDLVNAPVYRQNVLIVPWDDCSVEPVELQLVPTAVPQPYFHLQGKQLYLVKRLLQHDSGAACEGADQGVTLEAVEQHFQKLEIGGKNEDTWSGIPAVKLVPPMERFPTAIGERIRPILMEALECLRLQMMHVGPSRDRRAKLTLRFAKFLLFSRTCNTLDLEGINPILATKLERLLDINSNRISKSVETNLEPAVYSNLNDIASAQATVRWNSPSTYLIIVKVDDRVDTGIRVFCVPTSDESSQLRIYKIKRSTVRATDIDLMLLGRIADCRITLWAENHLTELQGEEKEAVDAIVSAAVIDPTVKGGLRWPLGGTSSPWPRTRLKQRLTVYSVSVRYNVTRYKCKQWKWTFQSVRNYNWETTEERFVKEAKMMPLLWGQMLKQIRPPKVEANHPEGESDGSGVCGVSVPPPPPFDPEAIVGGLAALLDWLKEYSAVKA